MRLTQIKLSGFKSFVDTTVIPTPSQRVGVVGPNGCGKSNIIDAVRWVLGESRASELRGGSMQDVIFSGSSQRKPAARASVELTFDNSAGRIVGQWGAYTEVAVRRELTRDGSSGYFINGQQVRRRDINDIFLGTGLGARGYAIIGQGMINRLIEAKPEELRIYLEEAAGVSKYKERRRETESRLRDTRENLIRLEDILQELEQQLLRLQDQAKVAQQYRDLQAEGEQKQQVLWWLRESTARQEQQQHFLAIEQAQTAVEAAMADMRSTETRIEQLRQQQEQATDAVQAAQGLLYQGSAAVSRLEAEIHHANTAQVRMQQRQQQLEAQQKEWQQLHAQSAEELEQQQQALEEAALALDEATDRIDEIQDRIAPVQQQREQLQGELEPLRQQLQQTQQQHALAQQRLDSLQQQREQLLLRQQRFEQELATLASEIRPDVAARHTAWQQAKTDLAQRQQQHLALDTQLEQQQAQQQQCAQHWQAKERAFTQIQAQLEALQQLQQQVQSQGQLSQWLEQHGLGDAPRLWEQIQVEAGWELALEAVLGQRLQALLLESWQALPSANDAPPARAWFMQPQGAVRLVEQRVGLKPLIEVVNVREAAWQPVVAQLLDGYYLSADFTSALQQVNDLGAGQALVVAAGHIIQPQQILLYAADSEQSGVLARQQQIMQQQTALQASGLEVEQAECAVQQALLQLQQTQEALKTSQTQLQQATQRSHELQLHYQQAEQQAQQLQQRQQQLQSELEEVAEQQEQLLEMAEQTVEQAEEHAMQLEQYEHNAQQVAAQLTTVNDRLHLLHEQLREVEQQNQGLLYNKSRVQLRIEELLRSQQQAIDLTQRTQIELVGLVDEYEEVDIDELQLDLQEVLEQRVLYEEAFQEEQKQLAALSAQLHDLESNKTQTSDGVEPLRQQVMQLQLAEQAARLAVEQYAEQLDGQQVDRQALERLLENQPTEWRKLSWLQSELQRINRAIAVLGAVNLAALEELKTAQERQFYLQSQHDDLSEAIATLEDAIRKIDRETRALLQSTFNAVNTHFGELFPQLFGGGEAKLIMTGDEMLDAGVQVMAQPPGKRNSSIQLLSGGEKALTATALVFAFFKLNPAPFCLLDEVDAPLDDTNTERYAQLVESMSDQTQFLFISHNKIAMQMAKQLVGVTMQEQGVSRIVAVDMDAVVDMMH